MHVVVVLVIIATMPSRVHGMHPYLRGIYTPGRPLYRGGDGGVDAAVHALEVSTCLRCIFIMSQMDMVEGERSGRWIWIQTLKKFLPFGPPVNPANNARACTERRPDHPLPFPFLLDPRDEMG